METTMYIFLGVGIIGFAVAVLLFFTLRIPAVLGELSGRTARREIARRKRKEAAEQSQKEAPGYVGTTFLPEEKKEGVSCLEAIEGWERTEALWKEKAENLGFRVVTDIAVVHTKERV